MALITPVRSPDHSGRVVRCECCRYDGRDVPAVYYYNPDLLQHGDVALCKEHLVEAIRGANLGLVGLGGEV